MDLTQRKLIVEFQWEKDPDYTEGDSEMTEFYRLVSGVERMPTAVVRKFRDDPEYNMSVYDPGRDEWDDSVSFPTLEDAIEAAEQEFQPIKEGDETCQQHQ